MAASCPLFQAVLSHVQQATATMGVRVTSVRRLALLVTGLLVSQRVVVARLAADLAALGITATEQPPSIARRIRRTLNDARLTAATCYQPVLPHVLDWAGLRARDGTLTVVVDESSQDARIHLLRAGVAYWGGTVVLAWASWEQNARLPPGFYWQQVDAVLAAVAAVVPAGIRVVVTADRAYDIPPFLDRLAAYGWHWVVRTKQRSSLVFGDQHDRRLPLRQVLAATLPRPGCRWKARGAVFKAAGWRSVSVVALWEARAREPLVVLSDLPCRWEVLAQYGRRWWIEPGFRTDKTAGWQWEQSQVQGVAHQERLLLGMAWASLIVWCLGIPVAQARLQRLATRPPQRVHGRWRVGRPQHARESVFTLGRQRVRQWLLRPASVRLTWYLPDLDAPAWNARWYHAQAHRFLFQSVRP